MDAELANLIERCLDVSNQFLSSVDPGLPFDSILILLFYTGRAITSTHRRGSFKTPSGD